VYKQAAALLSNAIRHGTIAPVGDRQPTGWPQSRRLGAAAFSSRRGRGAEATALHAATIAFGAEQEPGRSRERVPTR